MPRRAERGPLAAGLALLVATAGTAAAGEVKLAIRGGRVTLVAEQATVRQILDEWARVGGTRIVNADKLTGPPVSLRLENVPETQALETILRAASGFVAAPRRVADAGLSRFDRILILPASRAPAAPPVAPSSPQPSTTPTPRLPFPFGPPRPGSTDEPAEVPDEARPGQEPTAPPVRPVSPFVPRQAPANPDEPPPFPGVRPDEDVVAPPTDTPQVPQTVPRPGMIVAPPATPSRPPVAPGLVPPDRRRPPSSPPGGP
jgi:hypothetical protein